MIYKRKRKKTKHPFKTINRCKNKYKRKKKKRTHKSGKSATRAFLS